MPQLAHLPAEASAQAGYQIAKLSNCIYLFSKQFHSKDNQANKEDEQAKPVDAMHVSDPFALRPGWILLFEKEIFRKLI
ncbi:MAG TPA: hypothetical protein VK644_07290 [Chitinophagaceae bacterium]|nr:hypothetical protein [Chitinophagaceae bacterium]